MVDPEDFQPEYASEDDALDAIASPTCDKPDCGCNDVDFNAEISDDFEDDEDDFEDDFEDDESMDGDHESALESVYGPMNEEPDPFDPWE